MLSQDVAALTSSSFPAGQAPRRRRRGVPLPLLVAVTLLPAGARSAEVPFGPGERCTFSIDYGPVNAGEATLEVMDSTEYNGRPVFHLRTRTRSNRFFSTFYRVRDQADSYMDADSLYTLHFSKHLREGKYRRDIEMHFDHAAGKVYYRDGKEKDIPRHVQDVLSAFFRVRLMDLTPGTELALPTQGDKRLYDLKLKVLRHETLDTILGRVECVVVQPVLKDDGLFKHQGDLYVWLTRDARRIPVRMKAQIPVGSVVATLKRYSPPADRSGDSSP